MLCLGIALLVLAVAIVVAFVHNEIVYHKALNELRQAMDAIDALDSIPCGHPTDSEISEMAEEDVEAKSFYVYVYSHAAPLEGVKSYFGTWDEAEECGTAHTAGNDDWDYEVCDCRPEIDYGDPCVTCPARAECDGSGCVPSLMPHEFMGDAADSLNFVGDIVFPGSEWTISVCPACSLSYVSKPGYDNCPMCASIDDSDQARYDRGFNCDSIE